VMLHVVDFYLRLALEVIWFFLCAVYGMVIAIVHISERTTNPSCGYWVGRPYAWGALKILGVKLVVENFHYIDSVSPVVVVANHQSALDFAFACSVVPKKCVSIAKDSLKFVPVLGFFLVVSESGIYKPKPPCFCNWNHGCSSNTN